MCNHCAACDYLVLIRLSFQINSKKHTHHCLLEILSWSAVQTNVKSSSFQLFNFIKLIDGHNWCGKKKKIIYFLIQVSFDTYVLFLICFYKKNI